MALSFLTPSRNVLIIGDDSLCIYSVSGGGVRFIDSITWDRPDFENRTARLIAIEGKGKPVLLINDMTDQHFKGGQRMPKVGMLDRRNVLKRKLQVAFPNYPVRAALELKQPKKRGSQRPAEGEAGTGSGNLYIFAAVPTSEQISRTATAVRRSLASVAGFVLLPVDSADMVAQLAEKIGGADKSPSQWVVFIGQHRNGGLRQIVIRDGQLAMTRMTLVSENAYGTEDWAATVNQEIKATVGYLSRFGYAPDDGMDLLVIADPESGEDLKGLIDIPCNFVSFTVNEAANLLGLEIGVQENQRLADVLHAAWLARKRSFLMPLSVPDLAQVSYVRRAATVTTGLLCCAALYLGVQMVSQFTTMQAAEQKVEDQSAALVKAQKAEDEIAARMKAIGFDVKLIQASAESYDGFLKEDINPLPVIQRIGQALGEELRLTSLKMEMLGGDAVAAAATSTLPTDAAKTDVKKTMLAIMTMNFPATIEPNVGVQQVNQFRDKLQAAFPGYTVQVTKQVADLTYTTSTSGKAGDEAGKPDAKQDYVAELQLKGAVQ